MHLSYTSERAESCPSILFFFFFSLDFGSLCKANAGWQVPGGLWEAAANAGQMVQLFAAVRIQLQGLPGKQAAIFKSPLTKSTLIFIKDTSNTSLVAPSLQHTRSVGKSTRVPGDQGPGFISVAAALIEAGREDKEHKKAQPPGAQSWRISI